MLLSMFTFCELFLVKSPTQSSMQNKVLWPIPLVIPTRVKSVLAPPFLVIDMSSGVNTCIVKSLESCFGFYARPKDSRPIFNNYFKNPSSFLLNLMNDLTILLLSEKEDERITITLKDCYGH